MFIGNRLVGECGSLGVTQEDFLSTNLDDFLSTNRRTIACFGKVESVAPNLPFENLQVLHLEGDVCMQQFTIHSRVLEEVRIHRNKLITFVGFLGLPCFRRIRFDRCPNLKKIMVHGTAFERLVSLHISACQSLDVATILKVVEDAAPMDDFVWSDMFRLGLYASRMDFRPHVDFLASIAAHVKALTIDRFSLSLGHAVELKPMKTIFDAALVGLLCSPSLQSVSIRGSSVFSAIPLSTACSVRVVDFSSCKALREIVLYEDASRQQEEMTSVEEFVLDDCPLLETPYLVIFENLKHFSCQVCPLVTNDLLRWLPPS